MSSKETLSRDLRIKASMINLGERIAWGSETALMDAAADRIDALEAENARLERLVSHWQGLAVTNRKVADDALAQLAAIQQAKGEEVEVVAWQDAENPLYTTAERRVMHAWANNQYQIVELMTVAQHQRITAAMAAEVERLRKFEAAYNEWQEKTDWVQETIKTHELGKHRADVLKDRLARWLERVNQPYDYADVEAAQQKDGN